MASLERGSIAGENGLAVAIEAAIRGRRSVKEFADRPVPRELIAQLLELAVWTPNHRLTEPWRYYVLDGASRSQLGEIAREVTRAQLERTPGAKPEVVVRKADEAAHAWSSVPVLLYVTAQRHSDPELDLENYGATCCAVYGLMLVAQSVGLATSWSSGAVAASAGLRALAGAADDERLVGLIRLGYPAEGAAVRSASRRPAHDVTRWLDDAPADT